MIILVLGLPGSGKTTFSKAVAEVTPVIHLNADEVRSELSSDLGFTLPDRLEQARRMGAVARLLSRQGHVVVVDFVCPTEETRRAFGNADKVIWMRRVQESRYEDTNKLWENPNKCDLNFDETIDLQSAVRIAIVECGLPNWKEPTTLMLGRYQPWHEGHHALYSKAKERTQQVMLGVRNTKGTSEKDPLSFEQVKGYIDADEAMAGAMVVNMPNITNIVYGRDVGYKIEQVDLGADIHAISATEKRRQLGI
jgi:adenylylsulfate kinase